MLSGIDPVRPVDGGMSVTSVIMRYPRRSLGSRWSIGVLAAGCLVIAACSAAPEQGPPLSTRGSAGIVFGAVAGGRAVGVVAEQP